MRTYIVLLRGVMPTGKNKVPMALLRQVLAGNGFEDVRTYIQSGNVILRTDLKPDQLEEKVHHLIKNHIGADLALMARTSDELQNILNHNPFQTEDISRVFFSILAQKPDPLKVKKLTSIEYSPEKLVILDNAAYMFIPGSAARSKLSNNFLEKKLGISITTRNFNTLSKLVEWGNER